MGRTLPIVLVSVIVPPALDFLRRQRPVPWADALRVSSTEVEAEVLVEVLEAWQRLPRPC